MNRAHRLLAAIFTLTFAISAAYTPYDAQPKYDDTLFSGLELRGIGPALTSGRIGDRAERP